MNRPRLALLAIATLAGATTRPTDGPRTIQWERETLQLVAEDASYARIIVLKSKTMLATYSRGDSVWTSHTWDAGRTWEKPVRVGNYRFGHATNAELIQLADGRILSMFNERDTRDAKTRGSPEPDNGIAIAFSDDDGKTWTQPKRIYGGGPMWEPAAIQRDDGEIDILFADEKPYPNSNEQQISMLWSRDGGVTWSGPSNVSFRAGHRDGMPTAIKLDDGRIVMAIEDNGIDGGKYGAFKPVIIDITKPTTSVGGEDGRRWGALAKPLRTSVNAGAPYLVKLAGTALSAQVEEGDGKRRMAVWVGDRNARNFNGRSMPFEAVADADAEQTWNSLMPIGSFRVMAVAGTTVKGRYGIWTMQGKLVP